MTTYVAKNEGKITTGEPLIRHRVERKGKVGKTVVSTGYVSHS